MIKYISLLNKKQKRFFYQSVGGLNVIFEKGFFIVVLRRIIKFINLFYAIGDKCHAMNLNSSLYYEFNPLRIIPEFTVVICLKDR